MLDGNAQVKNPSTSSQANFNAGWEFVKDMDTTISQNLFSNAASSSLTWTKVSLPHTPQIEPVEKVDQQWQGNCFYRKFFTIKGDKKGKHLAILFEAAMHEADIYLNGKHLIKHLGGYLPFYVDITESVKFDQENCLLVKLNNHDNPLIPPGKPIKDLDFNYYGGIYRNVYLVTKDQLHLSNAVHANREAGGGLLLNYEVVSAQAATLSIKTEVKNDHSEQKSTQVRVTLLDANGKKVAQSLSETAPVQATAYGTFNQKLSLKSPTLWTPGNPYLYTLFVQVLDKGKVTDSLRIKTGVRSIRFAADGFYLNDSKLNLRGTNRHQEYPYLGYALSDEANYRDAWKIKDAGFNFVRCSHYPPSPAFLNACDELGIMVMDAIPGWQFFGNEEFQKNSFQVIRDMIRRDRNHPSIIIWEASLNESGMSKEYMQEANRIVHQELPFKNIYSCGWLDEAFDVFIPARQHAKPPHYWNNYTKEKPLFIAEYGDWEYYAQNAGFNQKEYQDLKAEERTSRQLRGNGEKALIQQALNYQESHNDNQKGKATGDANWLMFDYKRGYAPDIESSGIMDIFRIPKFAFYFYQSQYGPKTDKKGFGKPMIYIANYWMPTSPKEVTVYSNCEEVALLLNGKQIARQKPDKNTLSTHLNHPPFTFVLPAFTPGKLQAVGYIGGKKAVETSQQTPGNPKALTITADISGKKLKAGANDVLFIYATVVDQNGEQIPNATDAITFTIEGDAQIIGVNPAKAEAGIATIMIKAGSKPGAIKIQARSEAGQQGSLSISSN